MVEKSVSLDILSDNVINKLSLVDHSNKSISLFWKRKRIELMESGQLGVSPKIELAVSSMMNYLESQTALFRVLNWLGFFAFEIDSSGNFNGKSSQIIYCVVVNVFGQSIFLTIHVLFISAIGAYLGDDNKASQFIVSIEGYAVELSLLLLSYCILFCKKSQKKFLFGLLKLEKDICDLKQISPDYNQGMRKRNSVAMVVVGSYYLAMLFFYSVCNWNDNLIYVLLQTISYMKLYSAYFLMIVFLDNLVGLVGKLLEELDYNLKCYIDTCPYHLHSIEVKKIFKFHSEILNLIAVFNESFGVMILGIAVFALGVLTIEVYYFYASVLDLRAALDINVLLNVVGNVGTTLTFFIAISFFGFTCQRVQEKVNNSRVPVEILINQVSFAFLGYPNQRSSEEHSTRLM